MSGIKPIGQNTEPSQVLQERTPNTRSETQALERLDVFARQESMEELSPIFKHSGLFMPGQASLLEENQGVIETKYGDVKVISLEDMDTILSDPKLQ